MEKSVGYWYEPSFTSGEKVTIPLMDNAQAVIRPENSHGPVWIGTIGEFMSKDFWLNNGGKYGTEDRGYPTHFSDIKRASHVGGWNGGIGLHLKDIVIMEERKPGDRWSDVRKSFPDLKLTHDGYLMKDALSSALEWFLGKDIYSKPFIEKVKL